MSKEQPDVSIDEDVWASYDYWSYTDIEYLVLDIDPNKLEGRLEFEFSEHQDDKRRRVRRILDAHRDRSEDRLRLRPFAAIELLARVGHNLPQRLVNAVQAATCGTEAEHKREAEKPQRESALQKQNRTLRKVLLAIAVDRFRYSPEARSSAVTSMADCLTRRGMSVDTDTIRNHLQRAYHELDQEEKRALMGSH